MALVAGMLQVDDHRGESVPLSGSAYQGESDARDTAIVAVIICTLTLAAVYAASRVGFENPLTPVVNVAGLALFHLALPLIIFGPLSRVWHGRWWTSQSFLTIASLVFSVAAGAVARATGYSIAPLLSLSGGLLAAAIVARWVRRTKVLSSALFAVGAGIFSLWSAGLVWSTDNKWPLFWESFSSFSARANHDLVYFAAIANMMRTYGVPSTGIDGLPAIHYHYGSGWMFAQWADLIGIDVMSFYNLGYPIVVIPLFFAALLMLAMEIARRLPVRAFEPPLRSQYAVWIVVAAATIGLFPERALYRLVTMWNPGSESYLTGLAVFLLAIGTALSHWRADRPYAWGFFLTFVPLALVALGFLKVSLMILLFAAGFYTVVRLGLWRRRTVLASVFLSLVACILVYRVVALPDQNQGIFPLAFARIYVAPAWAPFFPLVHFAWSWIFIGARLWEERSKTLEDLKRAIWSGRLLDAEIVLLVALLGFLPGGILDIHGGSAFFFSDVQRWLALGLILGRVNYWLSEHRARRHARDDRLGTGKPSGLAGLLVSTVLAAVLLAPFGVTLVLNTIRPPLQMARSNIALRRSLIAAAKKGSTAWSGDLNSVADGQLLAAGLRRAPNYPLVTALREINDLPDSQKRRSALFIPQSYKLFWTMIPGRRCSFAPLVAPAFSGIALIDGMPPRACKVINQYNMTVYQARTREQTPTDVTPRALCGKALEKGFSEVLVLESDSAGMPRRRRLACRLSDSAFRRDPLFTPESRKLVQPSN